MNRSAVGTAADDTTMPVASEPGSVAESTDSWRSVIGGRLLVVAVVAWVWSLTRFDLGEMTDLGLVSVLPTSFFVALAVATVGFLFVNEYQADRRLLVSGYLLLLSAMAHATPALLYGTVRYAWSYRHLGVVDFIQRNGGVASDAEFQQIHHAWPGLFSATATLSDVTGISATAIAIWTPFVFSLVSLSALSIVFRCFVADPRTRSLALWVFVIANWVGQEYFSPQGFAFVLYLALLAIVLPFDRMKRRDSGRFELLVGGDFRPTDAGNIVVSILGVLIVIAIVASHQFTPIIVVVTFGILSGFRLVRSAWVSAAALGAGLVWLIGPALDFLQSDTADPADRLGLPAESPDVVTGTADVSTGQAIVVIADRFLTQAVVALAIVGIVAIWRRPERRVLLALIVSPLVLLVTGDFGEMIFRSYLFALPWLALASAIALTVPIERQSPSARIGLRAMAVTVLLAAFLLAYLGEERSHRFTSEERDLATFVAESAAPNTLLIEGSRNYPGIARNYERFTFVPLSRESDDALALLDADPEDALYRRMTDEGYAAGYVIITRSMRNEQASVPSMPVGLLDRIDAALRSSERFRVVSSNRDGAVFVVVEGS
ncbi:hypothetical protein [Ilumatobacter sp.]|uniref:hypothetical protein n=1 Tax=Ilumatobacter sp. TaxID=1967498 RepID=UPI003AF7CAA9